MHADDPTRIPTLMAALQTAWEGQPDLTLPAFIGMLHTHGMTWATSEDELLAILQRVSHQHPSFVSGWLPAPTLITTASPRHVVTLSNDVAVVRSGDDPQRMPSIWWFSQFRPLGPGRPVVLTDTEGIEHRLGVAESVTVLEADAAPTLEGLQRNELGAARWLILLEAGRRAVLGPRLRVWSLQRRDAVVETFAWSRVLTLAPGENMSIAPAGGGEPLVLGRVEGVYLLEV